MKNTQRKSSLDSQINKLEAEKNKLEATVESLKKTIAVMQAIRQGLIVG